MACLSGDFAPLQGACVAALLQTNGKREAGERGGRGNIQFASSLYCLPTSTQSHSTPKQCHNMYVVVVDVTFTPPPPAAPVLTPDPPFHPCPTFNTALSPPPLCWLGAAADRGGRGKPLRPVAVRPGDHAGEAPLGVGGCQRTCAPIVQYCVPPSTLPHILLYRRRCKTGCLPTR